MTSNTKGAGQVNPASPKTMYKDMDSKLSPAAKARLQTMKDVRAIENCIHGEERDSKGEEHVSKELWGRGQVAERFGVEEREYLNVMTAPYHREDITKHSLLWQLAMAQKANTGPVQKRTPGEERMREHIYRMSSEGTRQAMDAEDSQNMVVEMLQNLYEKIKDLSEEEFTELVSMLPLEPL